MKCDLFTPGRTELAGNHTDHQNGRILASSVDIGLYASAETGEGSFVRVSSEGFRPFEVRLSSTDVRPQEYGTPSALVRGVIASFQNLGLKTGPFVASIRSTMSSGSGLSSSAAFSVTVAKILNELFNGGKIAPIVLARAAQEAENTYFGKPCGLMSQITCAYGKPIYVDFKTNEIVPVKADFKAMGLTLCLTDTGGSHAGLDTSYARIRSDMIYIANLFDQGVLADVDPQKFREKGWSRSDRPVRRAMHFFDENERVPLMRKALEAGNGEEYMRLMNESGRSSETLLNNVMTSVTGDTKLAEGLEKSAELLAGKGAWRVHGGGFAGCVQALMPTDYFPTYKAAMEEEFGKDKCMEISLA